MLKGTTGLALAAFSAAMAVSGCMSGFADRKPSAEELDPGPKPTVAEADAAVRAYLREALKDPDSLKDYELKGLASFSWSDGRGFYNGGWLACAAYNAKNSYGAYVGRQMHSYLVRQASNWYVSTAYPEMMRFPSPCGSW
jgi:hypothetical protein